VFVNGERSDIGEFLSRIISDNISHRLERDSCKSVYRKDCYFIPCDKLSFVLKLDFAPIFLDVTFFELDIFDEIEVLSVPSGIA
jgi:hypothetical protein